MPDTLKVAIAGLGFVGGSVVEALRRDPRFTIVAGADLRPEALAQLRQDCGAACFDDVARLCNQYAFDILYVCTPDDLHAEHTLIGLRNGRHVVVDKPMALTTADAAAIVQESRSKGRVVLCGHTHVFDPPIAAMAEIVASGELGRVRMINSWNFNDLIYRPRFPQELDRSRGGSAVYISGPHQIDIVRCVAGLPVRTVRASIGSWDAGRKTDGSYSAFLGFDEGVSASLVYNGYGHFDIAELLWWTGEVGQVRARRTHAAIRSRLEALGPDEERLKDGMRYGGGGVSWYEWTRVDCDPDQPTDGGRQHFFGLTVVSCERGDIRQSPRGLLIYDKHGCREVALPSPRADRSIELDALYAAVAGGKPTFHDAAWGAEIVEIIAAMYESNRQGREVVLAQFS